MSLPGLVVSVAEAPGGWLAATVWPGPECDARPRLSRSAPANSRQLAYRSCGALAIARANTASTPGGRPGRRDVSAGGGSDSCA